MRRSTENLLEQLEDAEWFSSVGRPTESSVLNVPSWHEAMATRATEEWDEALLGGANQIRQGLGVQHNDRYQEWNAIVHEAMPSIQQLIAKKTAPTLSTVSLPPYFNAMVQGDIVHMCVEMAYVNIVPAGFYSGLAEWYCQGHFPCGWIGAYPNGKLIIY